MRDLFRTYNAHCMRLARQIYYEVEGVRPDDVDDYIIMRAQELVAETSWMAWPVTLDVLRSTHHPDALLDQTSFGEFNSLQELVGAVAFASMVEDVVFRVQEDD